MKHWNQKKQRFVPSAPFSEENNAILAKVIQKYQEAAVNWEGSIAGLFAQMKLQDKPKPGSILLSSYFQTVIDRADKRPHPDGTRKGTFENYVKCNKRISEYVKFLGFSYDGFCLSDLTADFVNGLLDWVDEERGGKGMCYISKMLHSIIMKADKDGLINADNFRRCRWFKAPLGSTQKYHTLTQEQCHQLATMDLSEFGDNWCYEFYRDFCLFLLCTGQSVCDAASLKYSDIQRIGGISHFVFRRRKIAEKQVNPCTVPISEEMEKIMLRWRYLAKDGYVFPVRSDKKLKEQGTNNGDLKHFLGNLNNWLKKIGKSLKCDFTLKTYTFRHTAITNYISKGVPVVYVANMMGTSVRNCESIYYNNNGDVSSRNKALLAMNFKVG